MRGGTAGTLALAVLAWAAPARADLRDDAQRLAAGWAQKGQRVERLGPLFAEHGRPRLLVVSRYAEPPARGDNGCTTLALLGVRTADFFVDTDRPLVPPREERGRDEPGEERRARSAGGAVVMSRCGPERVDLARVLVEVASSRAALEVVVAKGDRAAPDVAEVLAERAAGPLAPRGDPGGAIEPGLLAPRVAHTMARGKEAGAARVTKLSTIAANTGAGQFQVRLAEGCHRLELMAEVPQRFPRRSTDVDAEVREADTGRLLARDRADVPDARLDVCLGEPTHVDVSFLGAADAVEVVMTDAHFALPARIPGHFGRRARSGFAYALYRRRAPEPTDAPIASSLGVQGVTEIPLEVEPGKCYLAAAALMKGDARAIRLAAVVDGRTSRDEANDRIEGAAVTFCSDAARSARLEVDARGNNPWWALVVWPMGGVRP